MMTDWLTEDGPRRPFLSHFAKKATGSSKTADDDDADDEDDDPDDDDDEDQDDDPDDELTDKELRAALKDTREKLSKAANQSARRRKQLREERTAKAAVKPKVTPKAEGDTVDVEAEKEAARREGEAAGTTRAKKSEARVALIAAGMSPERAARAVGMLDLDDFELDDDGLDGIDEAIDKLKKDVPEFFAKKRARRESVAGGGTSDETPRTKKQSASERQAAQLVGGVRR